MIRRPGIVVIAASLSWAACSERPAARPEEPRAYQSNVTTDDVPIYRAVLASVRPPGHRVLLVVESTAEAAGNALGMVERSRGGRWVLRQLDDFADAQGGLHSADSATVRDFQRANRERPPVPRALADEPEIALTAERDLVGFTPPGKGDRADYWREFHRRFPGAVGKAYLSAIGFNTNGTQALVYVTLGCESECGGGTLVLLGRVQGAWSIVGTMRGYGS